MQNPKARFALALLVPVLLALSISEAARAETVSLCGTSRMLQTSQ